MSSEIDELKSRLRSLLPRSCFSFSCLFIFLVFGALIFQHFEYNERDASIKEGLEDLERERANLLQVLWAQTIAKSEDDWLDTANQRLDMYEQKVKEYLAKGIDLQVEREDDFGDEDEDGEDDDDNPWDFIGSFFYCFTVVTTIGYGNLSPASTAGKILTVIYGSIGIPIALFVLAEMGKVLTVGLKMLLVKCKRPDIDASSDFNMSVIVATLLTIAYLQLGGFFFYIFEDDWSLLDAFYFSFVTFSTIGFGDLIPDSLGLMLVTMIYSFSALALCGMLFGIYQSELESKLCALEEKVFEKVSQLVKRANKEKVDQDDGGTNTTTSVSHPKTTTSVRSRPRRAWEPDTSEEEDA